jgi:hypothetical protein
MNAPTLSAAFIDQQIKTWRPLKEKPWVALGTLLLDIEKHALWASYGTSFTEALKHFATRLNVDASVLWRARKAVLYYETTLSPFFLATGSPLPLLAQHPPAIGPEGISLLERLQRVAPEPVFLEWAHHALEGKMTRNALRTLWDGLRTATEGQTARGRKTPRPLVSHAKPQVARHVAIALWVKALMAQTPHWLTEEERGAPERCTSFFGHAWQQACEEGEVRLGATCAAVAVGYQTARGRVLHTHGVGVIDDTHAPVCADSAYFDRYWVLVPVSEAHPQGQGWEGLPADMGVLGVEGDHITVIRRSAPREAASERPQRDALTAHLLWLCLKGVFL